MWIQRLSCLTALLGLAAAAPQASTESTDNGSPSTSNCRSVRLNVSGSAQNRNLTGVDFSNPATLGALLLADAFPRILAQGSQTLAGTYCEALTKNSNNNKIQVLFGSITTNRDEWSAQGGTELGSQAYQPEKYSWVLYANKKGYPTLALDRLGNGLSSHPDPLLVTQGPYEDAIYHDLAVQIRGGSTKALPRAFSTLIWIGNSYGSQLGSTSAQKFPTDWNAYVLTGFSKVVLPSLVGLTLLAPLPAAVVNPAKFGTLAPGYVAASNDAAREDAFFGTPENVDYDPAVPPLFSKGKDVVSLGQFASVYAPPQMGVSPDYKGRVLTLTGERDLDFCGLGSSTLGKPECGSLLKDTGSLFPAAEYNYQSIARTGHAVPLHSSAQKSFDIAHRFLAGERFAGGPI